MLLLPLAAAMAEPVPLLPEPGFFPWAHVVSAAPPPGGPPGFVMVTTEFQVQTLDGRRHRMTMFSEGVGEGAPRVGSICWIRFDAIPPYPGMGGESLNHVRDLGCDASPGGPGPAQRDNPTAL